MKRFFTFAVILLFCFQLSGFYCYYFFELIKIHQEVELRLANTEPSKLSRITVSNADYKEMTVEENEIMFHGKMFDVATVHAKGDSIEVIGLYDNDEDSLLFLVREIFTNDRHDQKSVPSAVTLQFALYYLPSNFEFDIFLPLTLKPLSNLAFRTVSADLRIPTPPPQS